MCLLQIYAGMSLCLITTIAHTAPALLITTDNISTFCELSLHIFPSLHYLISRLHGHCKTVDDQ